ncbi:MAG: NGG1p interacting factor NIF3 [Arachnia sp.]
MAGLDVLVFYVPVADTDAVLAAVFGAGGGRIGHYDQCAFVVEGRGQFRPLPGAHPTIGEVGELEHVAENRVELTFTRPLREAVIAALRESHPYEEPAFHIIENAA